MLREKIWDLEDWFEDEPSPSKTLLLMTGCVVLNFAISLAVVAIYAKFGVHPLSSGTIDSNEVINGTIPANVFLSGVFIEEIVFRAPLSIAVFIFGECAPVLIVASLISSIIFGFIHGDIWNVACQGVGGLIYCVIFLKTGGFNGKVVKPLAVTYLTHLMYDGLILVLIGLSAAG